MRLELVQKMFLTNLISFHGGLVQVLNEDLRLVLGQQERMINGANVWNWPVSYDKLGVRYRLWRDTVERGFERLPFSNQAESGSQLAGGPLNFFLVKFIRETMARISYLGVCLCALLPDAAASIWKAKVDGQHHRLSLSLLWCLNVNYRWHHEMQL
jgi:hypothetical protein